jgi:hypothetical protein
MAAIVRVALAVLVLDRGQVLPFLVIVICLVEAFIFSAILLRFRAVAVRLITYRTCPTTSVDSCPLL